MRCSSSALAVAAGSPRAGWPGPGPVRLAGRSAPPSRGARAGSRASRGPVPARRCAAGRGRGSAHVLRHPFPARGSACAPRRLCRPARRGRPRVAFQLLVELLLDTLDAVAVDVGEPDDVDAQAAHAGRRARTRVRYPSALRAAELEARPRGSPASCSGVEETLEVDELLVWSAAVRASCLGACRGPERGSSASCSGARDLPGVGVERLGLHAGRQLAAVPVQDRAAHRGTTVTWLTVLILGPDPEPLAHHAPGSGTGARRRGRPTGRPRRKQHQSESVRPLHFPPASRRAGLLSARRLLSFVFGARRQQAPASDSGAGTTTTVPSPG